MAYLENAVALRLEALRNENISKRFEKELEELIEYNDRLKHVLGEGLASSASMEDLLRIVQAATLTRGKLFTSLLRAFLAPPSHCSLTILFKCSCPKAESTHPFFPTRSGLRRDPGSELYFLDVESKGFTLLTRAAAAGDADSARILVEVSGIAGIFSIHFGSAKAHHPLIIRSRPEHSAQRGADVNIETRRGHTALSWAATCGHTEVLNVLIGAGADLDYQSKYEGRTALMHACYNGKSEAVSLLLDAIIDKALQHRHANKLAAAEARTELERSEKLREDWMEAFERSLMCKDKSGQSAQEIVIARGHKQSVGL